MIFKSPFPSCAPYPETTIAEFVCSNPFNIDVNMVVFANPEKTKSLTYREYCEDIRAVSSGLRTLFPFLEKGDIVSVVSPNTWNYIPLPLGISGAGFVSACVNPASSAEECAHALSLVEPQGPKLILVHSALYATLEKALALCAFKRAPVVILMEADPARRGLRTLDDVIAVGHRNQQALASLREPSDKQLAMIYYSSGTTGKYKGVMLSHRNLISNVYQVKTGGDRDVGDRMVSFLPLYHLYGAFVCLFMCPPAGRYTVMMDAFDFDVMLKAIQDHRLLFAPIVPPIAVLFAKDPRPDQYDLSSLEQLSVSAAPIKRELIEVLRKRFPGIGVIQGYGLSEASPGVTAMRTAHQFVDGTAGLLDCDIEMRLVGVADGKDKGYDEEGELVIRGPNVMLGYIHNEEATRETIRDGWLHTGDVARIDKDGFIYIVDRLKELIKVRGFQVPPAELEAVLLGHPKVLDCAVVGVYSDEKATELPQAHIVVAPEHNTDATRAEIHAFVNGKVAYYKQLAGGIIFDEAIPKNPSGKILRRVIKRHPVDAQAKL